MIKALLKGSGLFVMGTPPGGAKAYRYMTREVMGTQRTHIFKLQRIWPEITEIITGISGSSLEGKQVMIQENGWTPFMACVNYLTCGNGGVLVSTDISGSRILERHVTESINEALNTVPALNEVIPIPEGRVHDLDRFRWRQDVTELLRLMRTEYHYGLPCDALPVSDDRIDFIYSGGALEHYHPDQLQAWLKEGFRVLKPGGILGVILDHRDHLYHFDQKLPFLFHYSIPDTVYNATRRNPLLYHNRLMPDQVMEMLTSAGFSRVRLLRRALPINEWFSGDDGIEADYGIKRDRLHGRFKALSDSDLKTAAAFYVYSKP